VVYPVKADVTLDLKDAPRWMRSVHFYDLEFEWQKFINDLNTRCQAPRVPFMGEDLPPDFVDRPRERGEVIRALLLRLINGALPLDSSCCASSSPKPLPT
jgi:hypothetical protein